MKQKINKADKKLAMLMAHAVRNAMEDFHCKNLTDKQMAELNPIIRNSIFTTLVALNNQNYITPKQYLQWHLSAIPDYWEDPKLIDCFSSQERWEEAEKRASIEKINFF